MSNTTYVTYSTSDNTSVNIPYCISNSRGAYISGSYVGIDWGKIAKTDGTGGSDWNKKKIRVDKEKEELKHEELKSEI